MSSIKVSRNWARSFYDKTLMSLHLSSKAKQIEAKKEVAFLLSKLRLKPGSRVLDIPCGAGRHTLQFLKKGYHVTGLDISRTCLNSAIATIPKKYAQQTVLKIGDLRNLKQYRGQFDLTINLFSSIGIFEKERENLKILRELRNTLTLSGVLVIQTLNRDYALDRLESRKTWAREGDFFRLEEKAYDASSKCIHTEWTLVHAKKGMVGTYKWRLRLYSKKELVTILKKMGLNKVKVYGDSDGSRFSRLSSARPIYLASV